jgi:hypothetical protein
MSLISILPTLDALDATPLHDVAAVVLRAAQKAKANFQRSQSNFWPRRRVHDRR